MAYTLPQYAYPRVYVRTYKRIRTRTHISTYVDAYPHTRYTHADAYPYLLPHSWVSYPYIPHMLSIKWGLVTDNPTPPETDTESEGSIGGI